MLYEVITPMVIFGPPVVVTPKRDGQGHPDSDSSDELSGILAGYNGQITSGRISLRSGIIDAAPLIAGGACTVMKNGR